MATNRPLADNNPGLPAVPLFFIPARRTRSTTALLAVLFLLCSPGCSSASPADPPLLDERPNAVVIDWNDAAFEAAKAQDDHANGLDVVRVLAMMHVAQHNALGAIDPVFASYAFDAHAPEADPVAAVAAASHGVLSAAFPGERAALDAQLARSLEDVPDGDAEARGVALGEQAAAAILALRQNDGSDTPFVGDYAAGTGPGRYQFTPPFEFAVLPGWRHVRPFALTSPDQFRSAPHPALDSEAYARDFNEVKELGEMNSETRSSEQLGYARFWYEFSEIGWNRIGRTVAAERGLGLQSTARLFALLNMAMSDAYVAGWDSKYHYDFWRPVTAIHEAAGDGNPATEPDPAWEPALMTPPVQDYPSTHSALGNAAATVLASVFGDATPFTFSSASADETMPARSFTGFHQAADENADSRVRGGLHFRFACEAGQRLGDQVAERALAHVLKPLGTAQAATPNG